MISTRTRIAAAVAGLAAVGATTVGAVSATAAPATPATPAAPAAAAQADGKNVVQTSHLSIAAASKAAQAALDAATKAGQRVSVAVVDRDGNTVLTLRGDGAGPQSYSSAQQKAFTAVSWNAKTSELAGRLQQAPTLKDIDGTLFLAGAVPVTAGNAPIAAIGVAGAPSGAQDETFAQAGVDALGK
ncbi:heme-binding protein [Amycolatopsis sp. SID8362]|uniref:GlcG/HbpS family heme-binding protein n=1 Tax=Amycolatopsis sp. SID8362 TaxID=2690346 RepID=UPI00136ED4A6|nr:heme-binding protein [Amycolatopsis sp. SID8362]NBH11288.1 heme-binding protein [Amycolatopsis sp. SID8362]NED47980.1 heme-binding protein [Amycolatopsis sp. SID8362]